MYRSQKLALKYLTAAMVLFGVMTLAGLLSSIYYIRSDFLVNVVNFNIAKILHIDTLIIWILMGFLGSIYWFLPLEMEREVAGVVLAEVLFWVFCAAVAIVAVVFIVVQYGGGNEFSLWFINQGRKYVEAPRWAAIGIALVLVVFTYNIIATSLKARRVTGITGVLMADMVPLVVLYFDAFPAPTDMSVDLFWWWWLVHLWVEATWEILIACIMAWTLMHLLHSSRRIIENWLYVEVALVLGTGILGLGHHYFWIGTPSYWLAIGGFFSALEPLPLLGMVIHAIYDAGTQHMRVTNKPAFYWTLAEAFGNFIGAGVWGFMMTLPQINLFSHGTQWTVSHAHFAFWGAYACGVLAVFYLVLDQARGAEEMDGAAWKWSFALLNAGLLGMVGGLLVAGMAQAFYGRAIGGSTLSAFLSLQHQPWYTEGLWTRMIFGMVFTGGYVLLIYDLLNIGKHRPAIAGEPVQQAAAS
jgi:nitric oxide reductase subunit B